MRKFKRRKRGRSHDQDPLIGPRGEAMPPIGPPGIECTPVVIDSKPINIVVPRWNNRATEPNWEKEFCRRVSRNHVGELFLHLKAPKWIGAKIVRRAPRNA